MANKTAAKAAEKQGDNGEWVGLAWAAWCRGERNITALAKQFGKARETVRNRLKKHAAAIAAAGNGLDPTGEYIGGLEADLTEALRTYRAAENPNAKVGALKHATHCRELLAAAKGVVTERTAQDVNLRGQVDVSYDIPENGALANLLAEGADLAKSLEGKSGSDSAPSGGGEPEGLGDTQSPD